MSTSRRPLLKGSILGVFIAIGLIVVLLVTGNSRDHTGQVVHPRTWANAVCVTMGSWAGQMAVIRQQLQQNNYGARPSDGDAGDIVEAHVTLRVAVDRALIATQQTLLPALPRAGTPDTPHGPAAAAQLHRWALQTEANLLAAQKRLMHEPPSDSYAAGAYQKLRESADVLVSSVSDGLGTVHTIAALNPTLQDAFASSDSCRQLQRQSP